VALSKGTAMSEQRTISVFIRMKPTLRDRIQRDADTRGQSITTWIERASLHFLAQSEMELEQTTER
jgi:hypothetical protein